MFCSNFWICYIWQIIFPLKKSRQIKVFCFKFCVCCHLTNYFPKKNLVFVQNLTDLCWSTIFSKSSSRSISSFSTANRSTDSWVFEPGTAPLHWIQFLFFFSINPMPSSTLVMSYIRLFCFTFNVSAAWNFDRFFQKLTIGNFFKKKFLPLSDLEFLHRLLAKVWQIWWLKAPKIFRILNWHPQECLPSSFWCWWVLKNSNLPPSHLFTVRYLTEFFAQVLFSGVDTKEPKYFWKRQMKK